ncbi:hypothetical protein AB9C65_10850 [Klebsiella pasteurii]|uniref:hypothetical protein n=1 Tax=Klebsiella pasteurii TaxID=2587529 RepID=UPI003518F4BB
MSQSSRYRNHRSPWTLRELVFVEKHYGSMATAAIADQLGRTPTSVRAAARSMGCSSGNKTYGPWTDEEKEIVRTHYAKGSAQVMALLPGRTRQTIQWMANKLGVTSARSWSREEERILATYYPEQGVVVADCLPGRTAEAVKLKACDMGIRYLGGESAGQRMWSEEEQRLLIRNDHLIFPELLKLFPHRSRLSVKTARERLRRKKKMAVQRSSR